MSNDHVVQTPKAFWGLKVAQTVIATLVLCFSCFEVAVFPIGASAFNIFAALWSLVALIYYFVAIHKHPNIYNWIALLVLECLAVIWWLCVWALIATALAVYVYVTSYDNNYGNYSYKRDLGKRYVDSGLAVAVVAIFYATLALGVIQFILYCVTLGLMGKSIHNHRKAGKPIAAGQSSSSAWGAAEKTEMQPVSSSAPGYNSNYGHQQQQYPNQGYTGSPVQSNAHEVGANRY